MLCFVDEKLQKLQSGWGSAPDPDGGAYSAPPYPLAGREGATPPPAPTPAFNQFHLIAFPNPPVSRPAYGPECLRVIKRRDLSNEQNTFKSKTIFYHNRTRIKPERATRPIPKRRRRQLQGRSQKEKGLSVCTRQLQGRSRKEEGLCTRQLQGRPEIRKASVRNSYNADIESKQSAKRQQYQEELEENRAAKRQRYKVDIEENRAAKRQRYQEDVEENRAAKRQRYQEDVEENRAA